MAMHRYAIFETDGGFCGIAWNDVGITGSSYRQAMRDRRNGCSCAVCRRRNAGRRQRISQRPLLR